MSVLALCVAGPDEPSRGTLELIRAAKVTAGGKTPAFAGVVGKDSLSIAKRLAEFDLDEVLVADHPLLDGSVPEAYLEAFLALSMHTKADVILLYSCTLARDLAPRLALRLAVSCITQCNRIELGEDGRIHFFRAVYGGKAIARLSAQRAVVTIAPHSFQPAVGTGRQARVQIVHPDISMPSRVAVVRRSQEQTSGPSLEEAKIVVGGGRGVGGPDGFALLKELAEILGGAVGASRAATDAGWVPQTLQIGMTGKRIAPEVYIAVGISGASQHLTGVAGAGTIVAINTDPDAPIFEVAGIGVVSDFRAVIPALIREIHRLRKAR